MERPVLDEMSQHQQFDLLKETDNGKSLPEEESEELLREVYGDPDEDGFYLRPEED